MNHLSDPPRDRTIEVHVRDTETWLRVKWDAAGVTDVDGLPTITGRWESRERYRSSFWLGPGDIDAWREPVDRPLKVPALGPSSAWEMLARRLRSLAGRESGAWPDPVATGRGDDKTDPTGAP